jgi:hypothetical protein
VFLRIKLILVFLLVSLSSYGQTFLYSYTDPCTNELKSLVFDMSTPIVVSYYGQTKAFTAVQLQDGTFESWLNQVYAQNLSNPCQSVLTQHTAITSTNLTTSVIQNVMNLTTLTSLTSIDVGGNVNDGSDQISEENNQNKNEEGEESGGNDKGNSSSSTGKNGNSQSSNNQQGSSGNPGSSTGSNNGGNSSQSGGSTGSSNNSGTNSGSSSGSNSGSNSGSSSSGMGSSSGSSSGSGSGGNSSGGTNGGTEKGGAGDRTDGSGVRKGKSQEGGTPSKEETTKVKENQNKSSSQQAARSTSKAKTNTQKPAILMTGDIVGLQQTSDSTNDARATISYTRVKGDGTASIGISADYMVNAKIGNITVMKSWIGVNEKGNKHINLLSSGVSLQPGAWSTTNMFIRVNSLKKFTAIYGAAGSYGHLYDEPMISTLLVGGFMYKGIVVNKIEATVIAAGVYSPYTKYYTETWWTNRPIVIPFFNFNYKITKTFGMGLTGGGTYLAGENILNYQILFGAKLIL